MARSNPRTADFTDNILHARAASEIVACFPVYRTYVDGGARRPRPTAATSTGRLRRPGAHEHALDPSVFDFLHELLTADLVAKPRSGFSRARGACASP